MKKTLTTASVAAALLVAGSAQAQSARDSIFIVGSSTVYPFATVVAENFGRATSFKTPKIESTGSGGGLKLFCAGVGVEHPDITNASRAIKGSEIELCKSNGVEEVIEVRIGYDGIVMSNSKAGPTFNLTLKDVWLALAAEVPDPAAPESGKLVKNPYMTWKQVNAALPDIKIEVLGPPPTSGTRDAFVELAMESGCQTFDWIKELDDTDSSKFKTVCHTVREDGGYVEAGENDNLIVQKLQANPEALGIFGFSFLDQNSDVLKGKAINGVEPTFDAIADGTYPISRPLFFYVKKAHVGVIPGMREYLAEFTSEKAWGPEGYLSERGLIPLPDAERKAVADRVKNLEPM
ncbi:MAG: substrate-binding domain-containing protein [Gammaproteobacteria bacterium]